MVAGRFLQRPAVKLDYLQRALIRAPHEPLRSMGLLLASNGVQASKSPESVSRENRSRE